PACFLQPAPSEHNPASASALAVEAARFYALRLGRVDDALAAAARALSVDLPNGPASAQCARLLARVGRGDQLVEALGGLGQALADPIDKAAADRLQAEVSEWVRGDARDGV